MSASASDRTELLAHALKEAFKDTTGPEGLKAWCEISQFPSVLTVHAPGGRASQALAGGKTLYLWYHRGLYIPHSTQSEFGIRLDLNEIEFSTPQPTLE